MSREECCGRRERRVAEGWERGEEGSVSVAQDHGKRRGRKGECREGGEEGRGGGEGEEGRGGRKERGGVVRRESICRRERGGGE